MGDLANGRTARSLAYMLTKYRDVELVFVAPEVVKMRDDIKEFLDEKGMKWSEATDLKDVAGGVDVLYQTRIQRERFNDPEDYEKVRRTTTPHPKRGDGFVEGCIISRQLNVYACFIIFYPSGEREVHS